MHSSRAAAKTDKEDRSIVETPHGFHWSHAVWPKLCILLAVALMLLGIWKSSVNVIFQIFGFIFAVQILASSVCNPDKESLVPPRPPGGHHVLLMSHYKEDRSLFDRLVRSAHEGQQHARWPITVVVAAEENSLMMMEEWDQVNLSPDPEKLPIMVAVHPHGLLGERPGPGSNLRNALRFIVEETAIPLAGTIVTKVDGNCWLPPQFFCQLEHAWATMDDTLCFQTSISELDADRREYGHLNCFTRAVARIAGSIHMMPTHVLYLCGFHSTYCMPLKMICRMGSWDPWLFQEDNLSLMRAVLASGGHICCRLLPVAVYNAPVLDFHEWVKQRDRCLTHGWFAVGFCFSNIWRLRQAPVTMAIFLNSIFSQMAMSVYLLGLPLMCCLNICLDPPDEFWSRHVSIGLCVLTQVLFVVTVSSKAEKWWRVPEAVVFGVIAMFAQSVLYMLVTLKFLFVSDSGQSYTTTRTASTGASGNKGPDSG